MLLARLVVWRNSELFEWEKSGLIEVGRNQSITCTVASIHNIACLLLLRVWVVLDAMVERMSIAMSNLNNEQNDIGSCDGWNEDPTAVAIRPPLDPTS
jgi:hypothetical protein